MKKEYKKCGGLLYCYDPNTDFTVRILRDGSDIMTFDYKLSDWEELHTYEICTKEPFKTALSAAIKRLKEVTK